MTRRDVPALLAALLTIAAIGVPAAAWWIAGARDVEREAARLQAEASAAARNEAELAASRLGTRLSRLADLESRRPFQQYGSAPADPIIATYFQIDASLHVTLSPPEGAAPDALRDLIPGLAPAIVASVRPECPEGSQRPPGDAVCVGPMLWRTVHAGSRDELAAVRHVETLEGALTQGFFVDLDEASALLPATARLASGPGATNETCDVPLMGDPWHVAVDASASLGEAAARIDAARSSFRRAFAAGLAVAIAAGLGVLGLAWQARRLARRREEFAAAAAHELRTPLAALRLHGGLLAQGLGDPAQARIYAQHVSDEADRLSRVVANLMAFTLKERGDLGLRIVRCDVAPVVAAQVERQRAALEASGAAVELACDDAVPQAWCDRDGLAQVVQNLLDNAARHASPAHDRSVRVRVMRSGARVEVSVDDAGPGVPPGARERIFRPFARGTRVDGTAGLGLGLSLSRSIARACGGELRCESGPRGGARFVLSLSAAGE